MVAPRALRSVQVIESILLGAGEESTDDRKGAYVDFLHECRGEIESCYLMDDGGNANVKKQAKAVLVAIGGEVDNNVAAGGAGVGLTAPAPAPVRRPSERGHENENGDRSEFVVARRFAPRCSSPHYSSIQRVFIALVANPLHNNRWPSICWDSGSRSRSSNSNNHHNNNHHNSHYNHHHNNNKIISSAEWRRKPPQQHHPRHHNNPPRSP